MNFYWTAKSIPELKHLPDGEREAVWHECRFQPYRRWQMWVVTLLPVVLFLGAGALGLRIDVSAGLRLPICGTIFSLLGVVSGTFAITQTHARLIRPCLRDYLASLPSSIAAANVLTQRGH